MPWCWSVGEFIGESVLNNWDRAILPITVLLQVFDSSKSCSLLERILSSAMFIVLTVLFGLSIAEPWIDVYFRVFIMHRVFSHV